MHGQFGSHVCANTIGDGCTKKKIKQATPLVFSMHFLSKFEVDVEMDTSGSARPAVDTALCEAELIVNIDKTNRGIRISLFKPRFLAL